MKNLFTFEEFLSESRINEAAETTGTINFLRNELINVVIYDNKSLPMKISSNYEGEFYICFELQKGSALSDFATYQYAGRALSKPRFQQYMEKYARVSFGDSAKFIGIRNENTNSDFPGYSCESRKIAERIIQEVINPANPSLAQKATEELNSL